MAFLCIGFSAIQTPRPAVAQTQEELNPKALMGKAQGTWNITADKITFDEKKKVYLAEGHVRITSTDRSIEADWAELDSVNHKAELRGNVWIVYGRDWIQGEHVFWNLEQETGWVEDGLAYFAKSNFFVKSAYIAKTGPTQYELKDGFITSCDPANADWKIRFAKLDINIEGIAWAKSASFWAKGVPVLYSPILAVPVERNRQSGFLLPWAGTSNLNGFEFEIPYYWAIRPDMDATFYAHYLENRGEMGGLEYRIANKTFGDGIWLFNYIHDEAGKEFLADKGYPFQTRDRYWLRSRQNFLLPYDITARLDVDMASDRNYLNEFTKGSTSYQYSDRIFRQFTGRGILDDKGSLSRESSFYLEQIHESSLVSLDFRYWDQLGTGVKGTSIQSLFPTLDNLPTSLQRLPSLSYTVIPSWIDQTPFYYTLDSSAVNYWALEDAHGAIITQANGLSTGFQGVNQGGRLDINPHIYYPMHWNNYLDIEPSAGIRTTSYAVDWEQESHDTMQARFLSDVQLDMSTRLNRVYPLEFGNNVAIEHSIRPEILYEYVPDPLQGNIPHFDRLDANQARHDLRYGFTTFLTSKQFLKDAKGNPTTSYLELARLEVSQAYNFERMDQNISDLGLTAPQKEGPSDVTMRLDITPKQFVTLSYATQLPVSEGDTAQQDLTMTLKNPRGDQFRLDYLYGKNPLTFQNSSTTLTQNLFVDEIIAQFNIQILPNLIATTYHDYSINQQDLFSQGYGLKFQHGCWELGVTFEKEASDERIAFTLNLLGIGNIGTGTSLGGNGTAGSVTRIP